MYYSKAWKIRMIQLIIVNVISLILGVMMAIEEKNIGTGLLWWSFGAWIMGAVFATFSRSAGKFGAMGVDFIMSMFSGIMAAGGGDIFWVISFTWSIIKAMFGMTVIMFMFVYHFVTYPFTSIYYFVKRNA